METEPGIITDITDLHGYEGEVFVYVTTKNDITGLHISKCRGFAPEIGKAVKISCSAEEEWGIWPAD
jgi:hypothetical protein